mmetsp:Transcript_46265/g.134751  ORF Transcript_46265/g.134751 Transcript_46265/m.134751 type:complete len:202 (+) Transcript_46265:66-671(+)
MEPSERQRCAQSSGDRRAPTAKSSSGKTPDFNFSGRPFTTAISNRDRELAGRGCGVHPRVWPDEDPGISEVPITSRGSLRFATTALAQFGGMTPRRRVVDSGVSLLRQQATMWHQHDHERSRADHKELRAFPVAGLNSARLGYMKQRPCDRMGVDDRPPWMQENEHLPGGWHFTPSDSVGDPTLFGRNHHFTAGFRPGLRK